MSSILQIHFGIFLQIRYILHETHNLQTMLQKIPQNCFQIF